ncbi:hypothetical protein PCE1_004913 [Barthelona sp. PCE]
MSKTLLHNWYEERYAVENEDEPNDILLQTTNAELLVVQKSEDRTDKLYPRQNRRHDRLLRQAELAVEEAEKKKEFIDPKPVEADESAAPIESQLPQESTLNKEVVTIYSHSNQHVLGATIPTKTHKFGKNCDFSTPIEERM